MIPSVRGLAVLGTWAFVGAIVVVMPSTGTAWWLLGGVLAGALLVDGVWGAVGPPLQIARDVPPAMAVRARATMTLRLRNTGRRRLRASVFDHVPPGLEAAQLPLEVAVPRGHEARLGYPVRAVTRGAARFGPVELRVRSPLGLWEHVRKIVPDGSAEIRVYPDFDAVRRYELLATEHRTSQLGVRRRPRRGTGLEFHQLRDYRPGDAMRQVDWKATSRFSKPISRDYQEERDQQIVLVLDCGRRMRAQEGEVSHFDASLDAALLVAHVALRHGDAVGLSTFGGAARWLAPRKGPGQMNALLNGLYDLDAEPRASDHLAAAGELMGRVRKRSLILWISNLRDEDGSELGAALQLMARRHLVLFASLREEVLDAELAEPVRNSDDAIRVAAIHHYLGDRRRAHRALSTGGALLLDAVPRQLPVALVNGYLEVKSAGLL